MLTLILSAALGQWAPDVPFGEQQYDPSSVCQRTGGRCFLNRTSNRPRENYAFFEFAPASGAGMGTACACTTPSGAKGEALTFTRTGDATCSKQGLATTGIANGDLVVCTGNQPRVESSGGVLGLRLERLARTNSLVRSSEFDNAAWTTDGTIGVPTANAAAAPDGTVTAERINSAATTGAQFNTIYQSFSVGSGAATSCTFYVRGVSTTGTTDICIYDGAAWTCSACNFTNLSWSRCERSVSSGTAGSRFCKLGNNSNQNGGIARSLSEMYIWGAGGEEADFATSYIPTVAAAVTRNAEAAAFSRSVATSAGVCAASTMEVPSLAAYQAGAGFVGPSLSGASGGPSTPHFYAFGSSFNGSSIIVDSAGSSGAPANWNAGLLSATLTGRYVVGFNGAWTICVNATCSSNPTPSAWSSPTYSFVNLTSSGQHPASAIWTKVQVDPTFSKCTP